VILCSPHHHASYYLSAKIPLCWGMDMVGICGVLFDVWCVLSMCGVGVATCVMLCYDKIFRVI
jgi:hypothetical protein